MTGGDQPQRREDAAGARADQAGDLELVRQRGGVHRACPAEGQQRVAPRVHAPLDRHHAERPDHLLVGDADDSLGRLDLAQAELVAQRADRLPGRVDVQRDAAGEVGVRREVAEQQVGVGNGRLGAAPAVAGRTGLRPGRARAHTERTAGVAPADRAAAGADGVHVDHRQLDRAPLDLARVGPPHLAGVDDADVAGGAAHVDADRVGVAGAPGEQAGADRTAGRPREHAPGPGPRGLRRLRRAAGGAHHLRLRQAAVAAGLREAAEVAAEEGGEVGVDHGGREALVLAERGEHLV